MLQFSRIKKMCFFKRETFCIIQRKNEISMVKRFFFQFHPLQKFCKVWYPILQKLFKVWWLKRTEILRVLTSSMVSNDAEILKAMTSCVVEILCVARFSVREILNRCFSILRKDIVEGPRIPTVSINFLFMLLICYLSVIIVEITVLCMLMFFAWQDKLVKIAPRLETKGY